MPGQQLVDGNVRKNLDLVAAAARRARQEGSRGSSMNVVPTRVEAGEHQHLILKRGKWLENRRKLKSRAFALRRPVLHRHSVGHIERQETTHGLHGSSRAGNHRFEKWQGQTCTYTAQYRSPRQ